MALNKPLDEISEDDLQALVTDKVAEKKTIEYKGAALPGNADADKKEFLADVSSFANAAGGHLIYGIKEDSGMPVEICGVEIDDVDAAIRRLDNLMRDGISPRLPGPPPIQPVTLSSKPHHHVIIIRVQRSWAQPHRVIFQDHGHFYSRNSVGKYRLEVSELRSAFELSGTLGERIRNFRAERLSRIVSGETPVALDEKAPKLIFHMIPFSAFEPAGNFDLTSLAKLNNLHLTEPLSKYDVWAGPAPRYNFDGLLRYSSIQEDKTTSYVQIFRNGIVEAVDTSLLSAYGESRIINGILCDKALLKALSRYLEVQRLGIEPPWLIMVSLLAVRGFRVYDAIRQETGGHLIDRSNLVIPEVLIDRFDFDAVEAMKPILDTIWNASGWEHSMSYDEAGRLKML